MLKTFSMRELPPPISSEREGALLSDLNVRLATTIRVGVSQERNVEALNQGVSEVFGAYGLKCGYVGPYGIKPGKELVSDPLVSSVGDIIGCTDIPIYKGVIGTAFRLYGEQSLYIPSVLDLERQAPGAHHDCREEEEEEKEKEKEKEKKEDMAELVIVLPKLYDGRSAAQECLDIDVGRVNPFSEFGAARLEYIIVPHLRTIFGDKITYRPTEIIHVRPQEEIKTS